MFRHGFFHREFSDIPSSLFRPFGFFLVSSWFPGRPKEKGYFGNKQRQSHMALCEVHASARTLGKLMSCAARGGHVAWTLRLLERLAPEVARHVGGIYVV